MTIEGPSLDSLLRRLLDAPSEFLARSTPASAAENDVQLTAVVHDVVETLTPLDHEGGVDRQQLDRFDAAWRTNRRGEAGQFALLLAWLVVDPWFVEAARNSLAVSQDQVWSVFNTLAPALADGNVASAWHADAQRREELVRTLLGSLELRPAGETEAQAEDRLTRISSSQRRKVLAAAREAEQRAKAVREALAAKAAQEAADKYSRE
jgi:hypothetical protein